MTKKEALYKYLKMDHDSTDFGMDQDFSVLSYNSVSWAFWCKKGNYHLKTDRTPYYPCKITERTILKLVKLL